MVEPQIIENGYYPYPFTAKYGTGRLPTLSFALCQSNPAGTEQNLKSQYHIPIRVNCLFQTTQPLNRYRIRHVCAVLLQGTHVQKQGNKTLKKPTAASMLGSIVSLAFLSYFGISFVWGITQPYLIKNKTKFLRTERLPFHHKCKMKK